MKAYPEAALTAQRKNRHQFRTLQGNFDTTRTDKQVGIDQPIWLPSFFALLYLDGFHPMSTMT